MVLENEELASKDSMKLEAVGRMKTLGIPEYVIKRFEMKDWLHMSDNTTIEEDIPEEILNKIKEYQDEFKNLVYHVVHTHLFGQETYECLAVSPYKEDWSYEFPDKKGWTMSHSINITHPENTESGSIQLENKNHVLVRIN